MTDGLDSCGSTGFVVDSLSFFCVFGMLSVGVSVGCSTCSSLVTFDIVEGSFAALMNGLSVLDGIDRNRLDRIRFTRDFIKPRDEAYIY